MVLPDFQLLLYVQLHKQEGNRHFRMEWNHHIESVRREAEERRLEWIRLHLHKMRPIGQIVCVVNKRNNSYGVILNIWKIAIGDCRRERWRNGEFTDIIQIIFTVFWNLFWGRGQSCSLNVHTCASFVIHHPDFLELQSLSWVTQMQDHSLNLNFLLWSW